MDLKPVKTCGYAVYLIGPVESSETLFHVKDTGLIKSGNLLAS